MLFYFFLIATQFEIVSSSSNENVAVSVLFKSFVLKVFMWDYESHWIIPPVLTMGMTRRTLPRSCPVRGCIGCLCLPGLLSLSRPAMTENAPGISQSLNYWSHCSVGDEMVFTTSALLITIHNHEHEGSANLSLSCEFSDQRKFSLPKTFLILATLNITSFCSHLTY